MAIAILKKTRSGSTIVEYTPHHLKVGGLSSTTDAGT
jgi:hypothetical protein